MEPWIGVSLLIPPMNCVQDIFNIGVEIMSEFISDGSDGCQGKGRKIVKDVA